MRLVIFRILSGPMRVKMEATMANTKPVMPMGSQGRAKAKSLPQALFKLTGWEGRWGFKWGLCMFQFLL